MAKAVHPEEIPSANVEAPRLTPLGPPAPVDQECEGVFRSCLNIDDVH